MKENEIMIGDWVVYRGDTEYTNPIRIEGMDILTNALITEDREDVGFDGIEPIPLTAEILEKNGFEKCNEDTDGAIQYEFGSPALGIDIWINTKPCLLGAWRTWEGETKSYTMVEELPINYVHELQHALRLCGIEKEIEL